MRVAGAVMRHRAAIYFSVAMLTLGGVWALFTLPAGIYPEVTFPRIVVLARGGTFEADEMTVAVTRPRSIARAAARRGRACGPGRARPAARGTAAVPRPTGV